jgi:hypothetical protein
MTEETYLLEIDSSQRDTVLYPNANDYMITVNRPMYNINQIKLISARIPLPQLTIDDFNNKITVKEGVITTVVTLTKRDYLTGAALAAQLTLDFANAPAPGLTNPMTVTYDPDTHALIFSNAGNFNLNTGTNSAAQVLGLLPNATIPAQLSPISPAPPLPYTITSENIDLSGPTSLILSLSGDERDDIKNDLYMTGLEEKPLHYFGRIITVSYTASRLIDYNGNDDPVRHNFYRGAESFIESFRVRFFCNNYEEVHPYDFRLRNHILKFEIICNLDKLAINKEFAKNEKMVALPPPLDISRFKDQYRILGDRKVMVYGGSAVVIVLLVIILTSFKQHSVSPRK